MSLRDEGTRLLSPDALLATRIVVTGCKLCGKLEEYKTCTFVHKAKTHVPLVLEDSFSCRLCSRSDTVTAETYSTVAPPSATEGWYEGGE